MAVKYGGTVNAVKDVLPGMRTRGNGRIVVMGSLTGYVPTNTFAAYFASIAAETPAVEERPHGVDVMLAAPNAAKTPLQRQASAGPPRIARIDNGQSSMGLSVHRVMADVDKALSVNKRVVLPGGRMPCLLRRLSPRLTWFVVSKVNR
jgi:short-subunit dehydrogenase